MFDVDRLTVTAIRTVFEEEVLAVGGNVADLATGDGLLFARAVLPAIAEVRPKDRVQGGVALKATETCVWVHPYVFRLVCSNGAIRAHAIQTRVIDGLDERPADEVAEAIREAVRAGCAAEAFADGVGEMRSAATARTDSETDLLLSLMPLLGRMPEGVRSRLLGSLMDRFLRDADRSRFGLMNAVTSLARDTRDPGLRWRLEELGGSVPVLNAPPSPRPRLGRGRRTVRSERMPQTVG